MRRMVDPANLGGGSALPGKLYETFTCVSGGGFAPAGGKTLQDGKLYFIRVYSKDGGGNIQEENIGWMFGGKVAYSTSFIVRVGGPTTKYYNYRLKKAYYMGDGITTDYLGESFDLKSLNFTWEFYEVN